MRYLIILLFLSLPAYGQVAPFVFVPSSSGGPVAYVTGNADTSLTSGTTKSTTYTYAGGSTNTIAILAIQHHDGIAGGSLTVDSIYIDGAKITPSRIWARNAGGSTSRNLTVDYLVNPPTGTDVNVTWYLTAADANTAQGIAIFSGVDQTTPYNTDTDRDTLYDNNDSLSISIGSETGDMAVLISSFVENNRYVSGLSSGEAFGFRRPASAPGTTTSSIALSYEAGAATVNMLHVFSASAYFVGYILSLNAAP